MKPSLKPESKGYRSETCRRCRNTANDTESLLHSIEILLEQENLLSFLQQHVQGSIRVHHELRVTLAACPNGCSQPQIKDVGIIGAAIPKITNESCTSCEACVKICREHAVQFDNSHPAIDFNQCLYCGQCATVCPSGTIMVAKKGFRVQLGGKLGRHPQLAKELPGIFSEKEVLNIVQSGLTLYKEQSTSGDRFADVFGSQYYQILNESLSG